jgi:hypothetical protein
LSANQRLRRGFSGDFYYTWSRGMAYYGADAGFGNSADVIQDNYDARGSYGPKVSDLRHRAVIVFTYEVPASTPNRFVRHILGGWAAQGITSLRTGYPLNVTAGVDLARNQRPGPQRPDVVPGVNPYATSPDGLLYLNRAAFDNATPASQVRYGNLGFNALRSPGSFTMDASIHKNFRVREGHTFSFRVEAFNALNHFNPGGPVASVSNPNFGLIQGGSAGRNVQLAAKYRF